MDSRWPQWTTEITDKTVPGEDQLGVEGAAQTYQQYLIPGIITVTDHARYYSFYAWVLKRFIELPDSSRLIKDFRGTFFRRHEMAYIAACYGHHVDGQLLNGVVGAGNNSGKIRQVWEEDKQIPLDYSYFQNPLGGFGQYYRTSMEVMGLLSSSEESTWVYRLTTRGKALAEAYEQSIASTTYFKRLQQDSELDRITQQVARKYGEAGCLCAEALKQGNDLDLLRDAFFRFEERGLDNPHVRRRLALGVVLDLVGRAEKKFQRHMLRPALYLGEYEPDRPYTPSIGVANWAARWKLVEIRHIYTFGLQCLFSAFLLYLGEQANGLALEDYLNWGAGGLPDELGDKSVGYYLDTLCRAVGLDGDWSTISPMFDQACTQASELDEYALYAIARSQRDDPAGLLTTGLRILAQLFLRFLPRHVAQDPIWAELADHERLPMSAFFDGFHGRAVDARCTVRELLSWLYHEFLLGQHEFIALEKLRYQGYDTFKFYYRDGLFYWPFRHANDYQEPIRLAGLRLNNALTMLIDLGLVLENEQGELKLSRKGEDFWRRTTGGGDDGR